MVRLVACHVEDRHDRVARELLDLAAGPVDRRDDRRPVLVEHLDDLGGAVPLAERRERREVGEQHAHLPLLAAEPRDLRLGRDAVRDDPGQVWPERGVEAVQLVGCRAR